MACSRYGAGPVRIPRLASSWKRRMSSSFSGDTERSMLGACAVLLYCSLLAAPSSGARLQEKCRYDSDCLTDLTYCKNQMECACKMGYEPLESLNGCRAVEGSECTRDTDCTGLGNFANSRCLDSTCTCREGFVTNPLGDRCLPMPSRLTDSCEETLQCTQAFGYASYCNSSKQCECTSGHHFANNNNNNNNNINNNINTMYDPNSYSSFGGVGFSTYGSVGVGNPIGKCIVSVSLRSACQDSSQCHVPSLSNIKVVTCRDQTCQCIEGYQSMDNTCVPGTSSNIASSLLSLLLMLCLYAVVV